MHSEFAMTGLGLLKQFLGLDIEQYDAWIKVRNTNYIEDLLLKLKMAECKEPKFPFLSRIKLGDFGASPLVDSSLYRQLVESLLYPRNSQLDLAYVVDIV